MEIYETEEEQVAAIKAWWKENGQSALVGLGLGIAIILGWNFWQDYRKDQALKASGLYGELLKASAADDQKDAVINQAEQIKNQFAGSDYAAYGALMAAKVKAQQGDIAAAKALLETITQSSDKEISNIARIRLVRLMLANKEYEQGLQAITAVDPSATGSFSGLYDELTGDLYVALDRLDLARTSYQSALRNGQQSPLLQMKIDDLSAPEKLDSQK